jgi:CRP/FNR family transcriptional regulator, cyclic AMP receptor protein
MSTYPPQMDRIRPFLAKNTFLGRLPDVVRDALMRKGHVRTFAKGDAVYRRGEPGDSLMVVITGRIKLSNISVGAKEVVLHFVSAGDICGEIAALDGGERAANAVALEDCEVFVVHTRDLLPTLAEHPEAMLEVIRALCEKVRAGAAIIEDSTLEMRARAARGLLRLARQHGRAGKDGVSLELTISQEELGKYLGLSRANVSRQLGLLKMLDVIKIDGARITVTQLDELTEIAEAAASKS